MPSHIAHALFAEDVLKKAEAGSLLEEYPKIVTFGSQGPDIFYHNRRTKPTSTFLGLQIHRRKYGALVAGMTAQAISEGTPFQSPGIAYIAAFITHAFLDRSIHPFINYFSGWVDPEKPETRKYTRCHTFFERIIDVHILERNLNLTPNDYNFFSRIDLGDSFPKELFTLFSEAFNRIYQDEELSQRTRQRIRNAYTDAMGYYRWTNRTSDEYFKLAFEREKQGLIRNRWHALVHPPRLPDDIDYLNEKHALWLNPCNRTEKHYESFWDLYKAAVEDTVPVISTLKKVFEEGANPELLEELVGNHSLSDEDRGECRRKFSNPLPLPEILNDMHRKYTAS